MDLPNLENYPMYILNMVPELSEENNIQCRPQITSNESLSYNFYVPNIEHHVPLLNTDNDSSIISLKNKTKSVKNQQKQVHITAVNNEQYFNVHSNNNSEKSVINLSSLLKDEDIQNTNKEVIKYDPTTDTNVIFHLVRPSDFETNPIEIKVPKRGRPRKDISESTKSETKQDESLKQFKPKDIIEYPLTSTKSGRVCKPPKHLLNGEKITQTKMNSYFKLENNDILGRKKVKYNVKSDFVCGRCNKTYLGHKRMQEHLERFPTHKMNTNEQVDSELQDIFQNLHETPTNIDIINSKKEIHTQTEVLKDRHCGYMKSKKNLAFHLKQVMKHLKKSNLLKSLVGTISVWDLLSSTLENGNLQAFSKELNTLITNLKNISKSLKFISESNPIDNNQMFIDDSLGYLFGLPKGSYSLQNIENDYNIENEPNIWTMNSTKIVESKVSTHSTPQNLNLHSSPIHLNLFDSQSSKVDFLLSSSMEESIMCDANQAALESVDGLVSERLRTMTDHLHSTVPIIDYPIASTSSATNVQQDSFMGHEVYEVFTNELNLVPTSTEEFIKSLEQFEPLNDTDNTLSTETRMLDFEDLQHTFHTA